MMAAMGGQVMSRDLWLLLGLLVVLIAMAVTVFAWVLHRTGVY
jgi:hypothetical protein